MDSFFRIPDRHRGGATSGRHDRAERRDSNRIILLRQHEVVVGVLADGVHVARRAVGQYRLNVHIAAGQGRASREADDLGIGIVSRQNDVRPGFHQQGGVNSRGAGALVITSRFVPELVGLDIARVVLRHLAAEQAPLVHHAGVGRLLQAAARHAAGPRLLILGIVSQQGRHDANAGAIGYGVVLPVVFGESVRPFGLLAHAPAPPGPDPLHPAHGKHLHFAHQVSRWVVLHVRIHGENRSVGICDVLHVDDHGVLHLGQLVPRLAFRGEIEAEAERSAQAGVDVISQSLEAVGGHRDCAQGWNPRNRVLLPVRNGRLHGHAVSHRVRVDDIQGQGRTRAKTNTLPTAGSLHGPTLIMSFKASASEPSPAIRRTSST